MKLLLKQSFKTIFSSKIFSLILMIIIFISSLTYTFLQTSTSAFSNSYDGLVQKGNLHDAVVKELYNNKGTFKTVLNEKHANEEHTPKYYSIDVDMTVWNAPTDDYAMYFEINRDEISWKFSAEIPEGWSKEAYLEKMHETRRQFLQQAVLKGKPIAFQQAISEIYGQELAIKHTESIFIPVSEKSFKVVKQDQDNIKINNLITYDGTNQFTKPLTDKEMLENLKIKMEDAGISLDSRINSLRGYRWTATTGAQAVEFVDPSSFQAVISPSFAHLNNKKPLSPQKVLDLYHKHDEFASIGQNPKWLHEYENNLVWIDKTPYFVIGIGNTPDFAYPILDHSKPIPNPQNEAIVYTNLRGYQRADDSFRNSVSEKYFSLKFAPNVNNDQKTAIKNGIESIARHGINNNYAQSNEKGQLVYPMAWPQNIKIVTDYNDTSDNVVLAGQRIAFLENLKYTIMILTTTTTSFLIIFVAATVLLVFKSLLSARRIKHATLLALGYSKKAIATSISLVTIILIGLPSVLGYFVGHFLQYPFINLLAQYWTIPTFGMAFSFLSLMITVVLPLGTIFAMVFVLSYWDLNDKISNMLRRTSKHQFSLARIVLKPLVWMGVKSKYVTSLTVSNAGRLTLSTLAGIISVSAIIVGASSIGRAEYAYDQTVNASNHSFQTNFWTPTAEGGQYKKINYHDAIAKLVPPEEDDESQDVIGKEIHWHIPSMQDIMYAIPEMMNHEDKDQMKKVQDYLKYKLQFKPIIDIEIFGINSWDAAKKLMPENQRNNAENNEHELYKLAANLESNQKWKEQKAWFPKPENDYKVKSADKMVGFSLDPDFISFIQNSLKELETNYSGYVPYIIAYDVIITNDEGNEAYTYINGDLHVGDSFNNKDSNIIGIDENSQAFNFSNHTRQVLENYDNSHRSPLVVNKYMAEKYKLEVGSIVDFDVHNHVNRKNSYKKPIEQQFEVVDVINTYDDNRLITRKKDADAVIGLDELMISSNAPDNFNGNGLFATQENPIPLRIMPVYSESNLYIATDTISDRQWQKVVETLINHFFKGNRYFDGIINTPTDLINIYSAIPYVSMFDKISPTKISNDIFKSVSQLTSDIIWIIQVISIVLSILFAIIVASLLISSNNKKIATLWTLGYYRGEVMRMFSLIYLLPIIFSIGFGIPIAIGILSALRIFVMDFGSILIPFALAWWAILIAIFIIGTIFIFSTLIGIKSFKNTQARKIIKEE